MRASLKRCFVLREHATPLIITPNLPKASAGVGGIRQTRGVLISDNLLTSYRERGGIVNFREGRASGARKPASPKRPSLDRRTEAG